MEFYKKDIKRDIPHNEIVPWLVREFFDRTGVVFADPDRGIRKLAQKGHLIKKAKGVYHYDPDFVVNHELKDFTSAQKVAILKRDGYRCVQCGRGVADGVELQVDHIKPKDLGGKTTIENGQILCAQHNFRKKNYKQTETGKKMFIRLYELSKSIGDKEIENFCTEILVVFEKNNINGHMEWKK